MSTINKIGLWLMWFCLMQVSARGGVMDSVSWYFTILYAIIGSVCFLTKRAVDASPAGESESKINNGSRN